MSPCCCGRTGRARSCKNPCADRALLDNLPMLPHPLHLVGLSALAVAWLGTAAPASAQEYPTLPRYQLEARLDLERHCVHVRQRVVWINRHSRPAHEIVFNVYPAYAIPKRERLFQAKMLEIDRLAPSEALDDKGQLLEMQKVCQLGTSAQAELAFRYDAGLPTALVVPLPTAVERNQS